LSDDWLWDGTPPEEPEDARITAALAELSRERPCPALPERTVVVPLVVPVRSRVRVWAWVPVLALAAAAALVFVRPMDRWEIEVLSGASPCGAARCTLAEGDPLTTDAASRYEVAVGDIGTVTLGPDTRLARLATDDGHLLRLDAGTVEVTVVAPPRDLRVWTPAALVVDLGCAYALSVDEAGTHLLVADGSVSLENDRGISIVTAGSEASVTVGGRPELPVRADASGAFVAAVRALEAGLDRGELAGAPLATILVDEARAQDLLTLWHVLQLVPLGPRARVLEGMAARAPGVAVDRGAVLALDGAALTAFWQALVPVALAPPTVAGPW
jgi:hypothetical protein